MYPRFTDNKIEVLMEVNQNSDVAQMLHNSDQDISTMSLSLQPGFEYVIDVSVTGQTSTAGFKDLDSEKRKCKLENEVNKDSILKKYLQNNCKYSCHINVAFGMCGCIPWDFLHNIKNATECDIFGRTCFTHAMKNIKHSQERFCPECVEDCDKMVFKASIASSKSLQMKDKMLYLCNDYFCASRGR